MFHIEIKRNLEWYKIPFTEHKNKLYCDGYVDAFDDLYPSPPLRIVKIEKDGTTKIVRETKGRSKVNLN